jgi:Calcium/calmodulin dependent protein kinase II association domain
MNGLLSTLFFTTTLQVSDIPRTDFDSIKDYFDSFLLKKPQGTILEGYIRIGDGWAQDNGIYEFTMGATGQVVKARYSFMYLQDPVDGKWKIGHHHSSQMPEGITVAQKIDENQVRNLFQLVSTSSKQETNKRTNDNKMSVGRHI